MEKGIDMNYAYNILVTLLATRAANSLGLTLGKKKVDRLVREATEIVVMDWCEFDYDKDAQWLELIASVEAGSDDGKDLVSAIISQMNFMGTLVQVERLAA
jgi:hypothetical protein